MMKNVLIIGAHYDDTELGCGGTAAKLVGEGKSVFKLTLTDNDTNFRQMNITVDPLTSKIQSGKACDILGIKELSDFQSVPCNELSYSTSLMQKIESYIYDYNIDTVFMHFRDDMNHDHIEAHKLCVTAARHCQNIFEYQSNAYIFSTSFYPTLFFDISSYIEKKISALQCYGGEHNRYGKLFETIIDRNRVFGSGNNVEYAEGFYVVKCCI